jgi:hypothetical protein
LVQRPRPARVGSQVVHELRHARVVPRTSEVRPDLRQRLPAKIAAHEGKGVDELDQPVGKHDQQRGRVLQSIAQLFEQARFVKVHPHAAAVLLRLLPQDGEERLVLRVRQLQVTPGFDGVAGIHRAPGIEAVRAQLVGEIDDRADLMHVEPRRREIDLHRDACGAQVAQTVHRGVEVSAHAHAVERRRGCAVEAHLHRFDAKLLHPRAVLGRQIMAVGFDLELGAARAHVLDHLEELRMEHRLAARKGQVRHLVVHELVEHGKDLRRVELVRKGLARPALLDAMQAGEVALVGDLPRNVERRGQILGLGRCRRRNGRLGGRTRRHLGHSSTLHEPALAQIGDEGGDFALDRPVAVVKALFQSGHDRALIATGFDLAHDGRGRRVEGEDLLGARLEEHAAEFLLAELHVFRQLHGWSPLANGEVANRY